MCSYAKVTLAQTQCSIKMKFFNSTQRERQAHSAVFVINFMFFFIIFSVHSCFFYSILCCILHESVSIVLSVLRTFCACTKFIICEFIIGILTRISTSIKIYMYVWPKWFNCRSKEPFWKASLLFCALESQWWTQNALRFLRFLHFTVIVVVARNSSSHPCMTENKRRKLYVAKHAIRLRYRYKFAGHIIFDVTAASYYTSLCRRRSHSFKKKKEKKIMRQWNR